VREEILGNLAELEVTLLEKSRRVTDYHISNKFNALNEWIAIITGKILSSQVTIPLFYIHSSFNHLHFSVFYFLFFCFMLICGF
jgi:hypothetical protein